MSDVPGEVIQENEGRVSDALSRARRAGHVPRGGGGRRADDLWLSV